MTVVEGTAQHCTHDWETWAWNGLLDAERGRLYIRSECRNCGTVTEGSVPLGHRVGARLPAHGAITAVR